MVAELCDRNHGSQRSEKPVERRPQVPVWQKNPFRSLFGTSRREQYVERYVLREHRKGRPFAEILRDPYVLAWSSPLERARLLERPAVVAEVGANAIADLQAGLATRSETGR
jgi:hypothetical protein